MTLARFTEPKLLVPRLLSTDPAEAINELTKRLHATGRIQDSLAFFQAVLEREYLLTTNPKNGVAFPHARGRAVNALSFAVGLSPRGISWGKNSAVQAIFLLAVPTSNAQLYLTLLATLSGFTQDEEQFGSLIQATQPEQMFQALDRIELAASTDRSFETALKQ